MNGGSTGDAEFCVQCIFLSAFKVTFYLISLKYQWKDTLCPCLICDTFFWQNVLSVFFVYGFVGFFWLLLYCTTPQQQTTRRWTKM
jgi:hypothetical protein